MDIWIYMILNVVYNNIYAIQQKYFWYFHDCKIFKGDKQQMFLHSQKAEFERHLWYDIYTFKNFFQRNLDFDMQKFKTGSSYITFYNQTKT